jgi:ribosome-associated protein
MTKTSANPEPTIPLEGLLKREGWVETGGHAKILIQGGEVLVNDQVETRRKKKLRPGDVVRLGDQEHVVSVEDVGGD